MKKSNNILILESKLKRCKIHFSNENGKIIIGKSKTDFTTIILLVILPVISAIGVFLFVFLNNIEFKGKIIVGILFLLGTSFFNIWRLIVKKGLNNKLKILDDKIIKIRDESGQKIFGLYNIKGFEYLSKEIDEETYEGTLYLIDIENIKHQILGFDDENEQYVLNDLKWFSEYLANHVGLKD
ncbi:conserved protein of unknown function [Tenacibaculum sp. 190524A02b]|uniref:YcxB-like protein domain-containing protein n=1 Tax=Tenacibaculum vairaonense TaxID=3137860 RepID=A0ABP1F8C7_9FLAO